LKRARPHLPASDPMLARRLLECGIEYVRKSQPETALVYFEFLEKAEAKAEAQAQAQAEVQAEAGVPAAELAEWLARARKDRWDGETQTEVAGHLQAEVNRRDRLLVEKEAWWSNEVGIRDGIIDDLRRDQEWMRRGWRRFVVGRPPVRPQ
jgi:hypothetical protein